MDVCVCVLAYIGSKGVVPEDGSFSWRLLSDMNNHHHRQGEGLRERGRMPIEHTRYRNLGRQIGRSGGKREEEKGERELTLRVASSSPPMVK